MKKYSPLTALFAVVVLLLAGQISEAWADNNLVSENTITIRQLSAQEVDALLHNDVKTMGLIWSEDMVVTNPLNKFVTKQQVLGMVQSGFLAFSSYERHDEYVKIYGDTAIVAGSETVVWAGKMPLAGKTSHLRFTAVWMKQAGRWQEVARHANIIPQQTP